MTTHYEYRESDLERADVSGWAIGGLSFAAAMLISAGIFHAISGLTAIIDGDFYAVREGYAFDLSATAWGWGHLVLGVIAFGVGLGLVGRRAWAGVAAIAIAMLSAVLCFFFIPYFAAWALVIIGLDVWIIWSLTRPGLIRT